MKKKTTIIGNTAWGYCFTPMSFESRKEAKSYAKEMIEGGFWFNYRIVK